MDKTHRWSSEFIHGQEQERARLAQALHDTTAQTIAFVLMDLNLLSKEARLLSARGRQTLHECCVHLQQSLRELRTLSYALRPRLNDECGLTDALEFFIRGFSERSGILVKSELPTFLPRMPGEWESALFFVMQEALLNVQRHGCSPEARVRIAVEQKELTICIDNAARKEHIQLGVGIWSMQERLALFKGHAWLNSEGTRTVLRATLPFPSGLGSRESSERVRRKSGAAAAYK